MVRRRKTPLRAFGRNNYCRVRAIWAQACWRERGSGLARREFCELVVASRQLQGPDNNARHKQNCDFSSSFRADGLARELAAGTYLVETEEELMDTVLSQTWKRVSTTIRLRTAAGSQDVSIDPEQLNAVLAHDKTLPSHS
jgi:hypothetical protein